MNHLYKALLRVGRQIKKLIAGKDDRKTIIKRIKQSTVSVVLMLDSGDRPFSIVGSGFCVDPDGIVVTCRHVMEAMMSNPIAQQIDDASDDEKKKDIWTLGPVELIKPWVVFYITDTPENVIAAPCEVSHMVAQVDYDLAAIKVTPHKIFPEGFPYLDIEDFGIVEEGNRIGVCGFPLGDHLYDQIGTVTSSFTEGIISSILPAENVPLELLKGFQLNVTATHGNSGGPVFSLETGKVLGVLTRGVEDSKGAMLQGLVKAEPVYPILKSSILKGLKSAKPGELPRDSDD